MERDDIPARRLRAVKVRKLFNVFDHEILLNEDRITIIHGPNGFDRCRWLLTVSTIS